MSLMRIIQKDRISGTGEDSAGLYGRRPDYV